MPKPKRVSQQTIARELGVSQALVSLTLNGQRDRISPDTYKRIWDFAMKAGYKPKGIKLEDSPNDTRTRQIGVILRAGVNVHTQGSYFSHVMHGLNSAVLDHGYTTAFLGSEDTLDSDRLAQFFGPGHAIKGVLLMGEVKETFLTQLRDRTEHIAAVSARHAGLCHSVLGNEPQALKFLVQHLYDLGHRRIGWLGGNAGLGRHETRLHAMRSAKQALGLDHDPRYEVLRQEGDRAEGSEAMLSLLPTMKRSDFPTAFITYNISMAIGAIRVLQREGKHVPADISIAAADYSSTASKFTPRITSAGCDPVVLGRSAAELVLSESSKAGGTLNDLVLASQLYVGESTSAAR
ncbi:LacI family DNA-binding transcriptional regulator [Synoicihabitans lomoniglobus]|uniref:LacI family DNA-binding transcriptional regulator n=1 Tax=Synoicihabitans lomoniglobus TaxID=2909285 RepID=A0AAF0CSD1_9BACT|nr:LacI family transcriptional regulator [Opitutaceae bacterium LMO-M01]WED67209.1 LacI family DNA-binding transcriptional regulator [Opitutaceae bacterium LMO-M01]